MAVLASSAVPALTPVAAAASSPNLVEDNFVRPDSPSGWGTTTNLTGLANVPWQGDLATTSYTSISGEAGDIVYRGIDGHKVAGNVNVPSQVGGDTLAEVSFTGVGHGVAGVIVQRLGTGQWYQADLNTSLNELQLVRRYAEKMDFVATAPFPSAANTRYWIRLDVTALNGTEVFQARYWPDGTVEPAAWQVTYTDTTPLAAGQPGAMGDWFKAPPIGEQVQFHSWSYANPGPAVPAPVVAGAFSDLQAKITGPTAAVAGGTVNYDLVATNLGPAKAPGVELTVTLPPGIGLVSATPAGYTVNGTQVSLAVGALLPGRDIKFRLVLGPTTAGPLTVAGQVGASTFDPNTSNNSATVTTPIKP